jgi:hypothetical protein
MDPFLTLLYSVLRIGPSGDVVVEMDVLKILLESVTPPWNYVLLGVGLLLLLGPRLIHLRDTWHDTQHGRRRLELEKQQLEVLKLRYEIEALRKTHQLAEIQPVHVAPQPAFAERPARATSAIEQWLIRRPALQMLIVWSSKLFFGGCAALFIFTALVIPFALYKEPTLSAGSILLIEMLYLLLTWGFVVSLRRVQRWEKHLLESAHP